MNDQGVDGVDGGDVADDRGGGVTLFDWLLLLAENFWVIVLIPVLVGVITFGSAQMLPRSYLSEAILSLPATGDDLAGFGLPDWSAAQVASIMISPVVLDAVIESLGLGEARPVQQVRRELSKIVKATVTKDGFLRINVTSDSPAKAQAIGNALVDAWIKTTVPTQQQKDELSKRLAYANESLTSLTQLLVRLRSESIGTLSRSLTRGESGMSVVAIGELQARYFKEALNIPKRLNGMTRHVVLLAPTLPTEKTGPDVGRLVAVAVVVGFFLSLLSILVRKSWRGALQDPDNRDKWRRARAAFGLRRHSGA